MIRMAMEWKFFFFFSLEQVVYIADRLIAESDTDNDGVVSFDEFKAAVGDLDIERKMAFVGFK